MLPIALDRGTTVMFRPASDSADAAAVVLRSANAPGVAAIPLAGAEPGRTHPPWARYVAAIVAELGEAGHRVTGGEGTVSTSLPLGAGLSSSAALEVAIALALGARGGHLEIAELCRRAEQLATGVPCGIMDQLTATAGVQGCALLIDCSALTVDPIPLPPDVDVIVVDSGEHRALATSPYAERRADCERAETLVGPLRDATADAVERISDDRLRRRARHVVGENARVAAAVEALRRGDVDRLGRLMDESHRSLRDDFDVSTPALEALLSGLRATPGVLGARLTGAGFGGCVVAVVRAGVAVGGWHVRASAGAQVRTLA